ncbi:MAG: B12-binding domain-containing radical SAM protein [Candidatus Hodarchaeota archaeon]
MLIYPPAHWGETQRFCQPLGILTLASMLKKEGIRVIVIDLLAECWNPKKVAMYISQGNFTHVGITILSGFRNIAYSIFQMVKKIDSNIITLAGGPHVTLFGEKVLSECRAIDIAVAGEAELLIADIIRNPIKKFYNAGYVTDIDNLPIPDRSFVRHNKYDRMSNLWFGDSASIKWVRGCSWRKCRFCGRHDLTKMARWRSPEKIVEEIAILQNEMNYKNLIVVDDSIRINSKFVKKILRLKIKEGLDIPFWSMCRADHTDEEGMRLMNRAGATGLLIGLESIVPRIIEIYNKTNKPRLWYKKLDQTFELADKYQIIAIACFILGGPTETEKELWTTINYCRTAKLDFIQPFPFIFSIGTEIWEEAIQKGHIQPNQLWTYTDRRYGLTPWTTEELFSLAVKAQNLVENPLLNPRRYIRLFRKLIKSKRFIFLGQNFIRLPLILNEFRRKQTYEILPEDIHA